jgi:hypothetical protein
MPYIYEIVVVDITSSLHSGVLVVIEKNRSIETKVWNIING